MQWFMPTSMDQTYAVILQPRTSHHPYKLAYDKSIIKFNKQG